MSRACALLLLGGLVLASLACSRAERGIAVRLCSAVDVQACGELEVTLSSDAGVDMARYAVTPGAGGVTFTATVPAGLSGPVSLEVRCTATDQVVASGTAELAQEMTTQTMVCTPPADGGPDGPPPDARPDADGEDGGDGGDIPDGDAGGGRDRMDGVDVPMTCDAACASGEECQSGTCVCAAPRTRCKPGGCVDTDSDPQNCGACGTTCEAGCTGGLCDPTVITAAETLPTALVYSAARQKLFWLNAFNGGSINAITPEGTLLQRLDTSAEAPVALSVATDGAAEVQGVYYVTATSVRYIGFDGTAPRTYAVTEANNNSIAVAGPTIIWTNSTALRADARTQFPDGAPYGVRGDENRPRAVAFGPQGYYWLTQGTGSDGALYSYDGGGLHTFVTGLANPWAYTFGVDGAIYIASRGDFTPGTGRITVWTQALGDRPLFDAIDDPAGGVAVDDAHSFVYWLESGQGARLMRGSKLGGTPCPVVSDIDCPSALALTPDRICWTSGMGCGTGSVSCLPLVEADRACPE